MSDKKEPKKSIIDVTHPDDTAPSETSRPIIVKNRAIIKDPMMVDETAPKADEAPKDDVSSTEEPEDIHKIEVKTTVVKPDMPEAVVVDEVEEKPEEVAAVTPEAPAEEEAEPPIAATESFSDDSNVLKDPNKDEDQLEQEASKHEEEVQKLVDSKKYYLPINSLEKRRTHKVVVIGTILSIALGLLWLNIALDAELINIGGIEALTDFF